MVIYITPDGRDPKLGPLLAEFEALGALTAGFLLDPVSYALRATQGAKAGGMPPDVEALGNVIAGPVRLVQRGDDLVEAIHDLLGRGRGGKVRGRTAQGERAVSMATVTGGDTN